MFHRRKQLVDIEKRIENLEKALAKVVDTSVKMVDWIGRIREMRVGASEEPVFEIRKERPPPYIR
jgi:hypothetical protein